MTGEHPVCLRFPHREQVSCPLFPPYFPIEADIERVEKMGVRCVVGNFAVEADVVRHAAGRVTGALLALGHARAARAR